MRGSQTFMMGLGRVPGNIPLTDIGYKYRSQKVIGFIYAEGVRSNKPGVPYLYCYPENYSNVYICTNFCLCMTARHFISFNSI